MYAGRHEDVSRTVKELKTCFNCRSHVRSVATYQMAWSRVLTYQASEINIRDDRMAETSEVILSKLLSCDGESKAQIEMISPSWNQLTSVPAPNPVYFSEPVPLLLPYPVQMSS